MPTYRVQVETLIDEFYEIDAESEDEARDNWHDGFFLHSEAQHGEVVKIVCIEG